jgi:MoaA/NifB/PqqE/SkfB family radical SAM enzyme
MIAHGLLSTRHPVLAHIIPIRRCNLSCGYCNEFDDTSRPVPLKEMFRRIDRLAELGTSIITQSGGEPLLHPDLDQIIARVRRRGSIAGMITNGYLLTPERIRELNHAGLDHLQISIDNAWPDEISKKSLKVLDQKLVLLAEHAEFQININSVLGSGVKKPEDALTVARRALELGFTSNAPIRGLTSSSTTSHAARPTSGAAGQVLGICTFAKTGWCTGVRNSAAIREFP